MIISKMIYRQSILIYLLGLLFIFIGLIYIILNFVQIKTEGLVEKVITMKGHKQEQDNILPLWVSGGQKALAKEILKGEFFANITSEFRMTLYTNLIQVPMA